MAGVNLYLDPQGLAEEGVTTETPVTINLQNEIMLKSALNLILEPLHLSYVVKDEVLKITSEQMRDSQVYTYTYSVADLVIPIPNFVPTPMGLQAAYDKAMADVGLRRRRAVRLLGRGADDDGGRPRRQAGRRRHQPGHVGPDDLRVPPGCDGRREERAARRRRPRAASAAGRSPTSTA